MGLWEVVGVTNECRSSRRVVVQMKSYLTVRHDENLLEESRRKSSTRVRKLGRQCHLDRSMRNPFLLVSLLE